MTFWSNVKVQQTFLQQTFFFRKGKILSKFGKVYLGVPFTITSEEKNIQKNRKNVSAIYTHNQDV